ncbi:ABC transporter B family member 11-like [Olea europaea subsp. europaea]|uniref:ABC transporter B family member 11-like n=1 Tax=Olea europaea subsp. europaea TaxID=158383 RepID=A0A8S0Q568_OLEEU|nr:ABC transporter B family member 11-like [Olea europaea subsp. europaea]
MTETNLTSVWNLVDNQVKKMSFQHSISEGSSGAGNSSRHSLSVTFGLPTALSVPETKLAHPDMTPHKTSKSLQKFQFNTLPISISLSVIKTFFETPHKLRKNSKFWALIFVVLGAVALVAYPARTYLFGVDGNKLIKRIRLLCFEKVVNMEVGWFDEPEHSSGVIVARLLADAATIRALVGDAFAQIVQDTTAAVAMYEEANQVANDAVGSIRLVASFCTEENVMNMYKLKCEGPMRNALRQGLISVIGFGLSFSLLFLVFFALAMATISISRLSSFAPDSSKAKTPAASIFAMLDRKSKIDPSDEAGMTLESIKRAIELNHVSFKYPIRPDIQIF